MSPRKTDYGFNNATNPVTKQEMLNKFNFEVMRPTLFKPIRNLRTQALGQRAKSTTPNYVALNKISLKSARHQTPANIPNLDVPLTPLKLDSLLISKTPENKHKCGSHGHGQPNFKHQAKLTFLNSMSPEQSKPISIKDILETDELDQMKENKLDTL